MVSSVENEIEIELAAKVLTSCFSEDTLTVWWLRNDKNRDLALEEFFKNTIRKCLKGGGIVIAAEDFKGILVCDLRIGRENFFRTIVCELKNDLHTSGLTKVWRMIYLRFQFSMIRRNLYHGEAGYIGFIGVLPGFRNRSIGSNLIRELVSKPSIPKIITLETSSLVGKEFFTNLGFAFTTCTILSKTPLIKVDFGSASADSIREKLKVR